MSTTGFIQGVEFATATESKSWASISLNTRCITPQLVAYTIQPFTIYRTYFMIALLHSTELPY